MGNTDSRQQILIDEMLTSLKDLKAATDYMVEKVNEIKEVFDKPDAVCIAIGLYMLRVTEEHNKVMQHAHEVIEFEKKKNIDSDMENTLHEHM